MFKSTFTKLLLILLVSSTAFAETKKLTITGSSTMAPVISEIAKNYEERNKEIRIDVQTGGSTRGIRDAKTGLANLGMSSRELSEQEAQNLQTKTVAIDGVGFVINISNSVQNLSSDQAKMIITGQINNWSALGGQDAEIVFINRADGRSELELLSEYFKIPTVEFNADLIAAENQEVVKLVSQNKNAISYLSIGTAEYEIKNLAPLKLISLNNKEASRDAVLAKEYPIARPLVLIVRENVEPESKDFLNYVLNKQSQNIFEQNYFIRVQ